MLPDLSEELDRFRFVTQFTQIVGRDDHLDIDRNDILLCLDKPSFLESAHLTCSNRKTPFLFDVTMSGRPSPLTSPMANWVPISGMLGFASCLTGRLDWYQRDC